MKLTKKDITKKLLDDCAIDLNKVVDPEPPILIDKNKDRAGHPICSKCNIIFSRCDMKFWKKEMFDYYWNGNALKNNI